MSLDDKSTSADIPKRTETSICVHAPNETAAKGADKIAMYKWVVHDQPGRLVMLPKTKLAVDMTYQRTASADDLKVKRIAAEWSWVAFGALIVALRDGRHFVVDGQHRYLAALKRSDVTNLPCVVFDSKSSTEEAEGFLRANRNRKPMSAIQSFKAMVVSGDNVAIAVRDMLDERGLEVAETRRNGSTFSAPGVLMKIAGRDLKTAKLSLSLTADICLPDNIHSSILRGLAHLHPRMDDPGIGDARFAKRAIQVGRDAILESIGKAKAFRGVSGDRVEAEGVLEAVNYRLQHRFEAKI